MLGDVDRAVWTVRDKNEDIIAEFRTEDEAINYGSMLANADPNECYSVVVGRWKPVGSFQTPRRIET